MGDVNSLLLAFFFMATALNAHGKWRDWLSASDAEYGDTAAIIQINQVKLGT
jgi:hypothetical protein